jgi:hypothetical protein
MQFPDTTKNWLPPPVGYGRERVAAIIEAATGRSPLGPCHLRVMREQRAHMVAMAKAALGIGPARKPLTLTKVIKQAKAAGIDASRIEIKPDGTIAVVTGKPESVEPDNPWPLDEFRTKENKQ